MDTGRALGPALLVVGLLWQTACRPTVAGSPPATSVPPGLAATLTPFLPRGFSNLPTPFSSQASATAGPISPSATAIQFDLELLMSRLNQLRGSDGTAALQSDSGLDDAAHDRAEALAHAGSLRIPGENVTNDLAAAGYAGRIAVIALSVDRERGDPIGLALQAMLTDPPNRSLILSPDYTAAGVGRGDGVDSWTLVILLVEHRPAE